VLGAAAILAVAIVALRQRNTPAAEEGSAPAETPAQTPAVAVATRNEAQPQAAPAPAATQATFPNEPRPANGAPHGKVTFPDGSVVEAINDVAEDMTMVWDEQPFSPIVDKVFHNGWWWWKHQDGAYSTVKMIDMNGVPQAMSQLAREGKGPPAKTLDQAIEERKKAEQQGAGR
jgi:hypothetical protein